jgi:hypothetical protein
MYDQRNAPASRGLESWRAACYTPLLVTPVEQPAPLREEDQTGAGLNGAVDCTAYLTTSAVILN